MKLFQYEKFFTNHFDPEVKKRGTSLIALVEKLQFDLLSSPKWIDQPIQKGCTRMNEIKLLAIIHAIDRTGSKSEAAKWLGINRTTVYDFIDKWNKQFPGYEKTHNNSKLNNTAPSTNGLPNNQTSSTGKRIGRINQPKGLPVSSQGLP